LRILALLFAFLVTACATAAPPAPAAMDAVARDYVRLILAIGEHEEGYVDAYYGPPEWQAEAKANKRSVAVLKTDADRLIAALGATSATGDAAARRAFLLAHLRAARTRLDMIEGARPAFQDEAEALFAIRPELRPLSSYDPVLARVEALVPGPGPLAERVEAFRSRYVVPRDRLDAVMRASIAECRRRTLQHIQLPADEAFTLEFVTGKSWSGYNYYKGAHKSLIQINTDLPVFVDRAVDLGCHEGYPGHHAHNVLLESRQVEARKNIEFSVYPLFSPLSFIAEGSSNAGIELVFPGEQRTRFEAEVLYPLAGLDPATAPALSRLLAATSELATAQFTVAADYLAGRISRDEAATLLQRYMLTSRARAEQRVRFIDQYRSYVINYGLGQQRVAAHLERAGATPAARWDAMEQLLSGHTLPGHLRR
jgi:hypothetical protein